MNYHPYGPCSHCSNPGHSASNCPSWGQFHNFSFEQMNRNFSSPGFNSNSNFYNPDWSNHSNFSWQAQAMRNYAPQFQELHHPEYLQFGNQVLNHSSYDPLPKKSLEDTLKEFMEITGQSTTQVLQPEPSLEDMLKEFMENTSQTLQELKNVTMVDSSAIREIKDAIMANTSAIQRLEGQLNHLVAEFNRLEEEKFQRQLMAEGHYMIDEDDSSYLHHELVQATATFESKEIVDGNEEEEKHEHLEHTEPPSYPNLSTDKEVSTEAHSIITIPLETFHEPQASVLQCLQKPSSAKNLKDRCTKSRNHRPTKILRSKQVGHLRRRHILPEGYQILKKKGWKGLVGHPCDRGRRKFSFPFYFLYI
jgi:hypothetical protein